MINKGIRKIASVCSWYILTYIRINRYKLISSSKTPTNNRPMICLVCTTSLFGWAQNWMISCRLCDELDVHLEHRWHLKSTVMLCYYKYIVQNNMRQLGCTVFIGARMSTSIRVLLYDARRLRCGGIERCHQLAITYWHCHWDTGHKHKYLITYDTNALSKKLVKSTSQPNSCMS